MLFCKLLHNLFALLVLCLLIFYLTFLLLYPLVFNIFFCQRWSICLIEKIIMMTNVYILVSYCYFVLGLIECKFLLLFKYVCIVVTLLFFSEVIWYSHWCWIWLIVNSRLIIKYRYRLFFNCYFCQGTGWIDSCIDIFRHLERDKKQKHQNIIFDKASIQCTYYPIVIFTFLNCVQICFN